MPVVGLKKDMAGGMFSESRNKWLKYAGCFSNGLRKVFLC